MSRYEDVKTLRASVLERMGGNACQEAQLFNCDGDQLLDGSTLLESGVVDGDIIAVVIEDSLQWVWDDKRCSGNDADGVRHGDRFITLSEDGAFAHFCGSRAAVRGVESSG